MEERRDPPAPERSAASRALARELAEVLDTRIDALSEAATEAVFREVPGYRPLLDTPHAADVAAHIREHVETMVRFLGRGEAVTPEDFFFARPHTAQRVGHVSLADFVQAWFVWQQTVWSAIKDAMSDDTPAAAAVDAFGDLAAYLKVAATYAAESYTDSEKLLADTGESVRRDLLEDLLNRSDPQPGPGLVAARAAGLDVGGRCMVLCARAVDPSADEHSVRGAASALARSLGAATPPLAVVRRDEIVIVMTLAGSLEERFEERLRATHAALEERGIPLAVGLSTPHELFDGVCDAYSEASDACNGQLPRAGVVALSTVSAFDYLTAHADRTSRRLVSESAAAFAEEDREMGGTLIATVRAYIDCNLNVTETAERLNVHVNTARHRLARVEERTGCNLRRVDDVIELLIAIRLAA